MARAAEPTPVASGAPVASGDAPAGAKGDADALRRAQRMLLERAKQRFEAGRGSDEAASEHLRSALDALHLAYRLSPAPWLLFNMAQVQSRLGACRDAADLYRRFLASDPAPEARESATRALELLGNCDAAEPVPSPGDGLAPGLFLAPPLESIFLARGSTGAATPLPAPDPQQASTSASAATVLPWAFGSLAVISGVAGLVYWNEANAAKDDLDALRVAGPRVAETQQRGESAQALSRVFGGCAIGFALAAGASYWWLRSSESDEPPPVASALQRLTWFPLTGGAGAAYRSEF